jgi:hypothetical protein
MVLHTESLTVGQRKASDLSLARWPQATTLNSADEPTPPGWGNGDIYHYARLLLEAALHKFGRLLIQSVIMVPIDDGPHYCICSARVSAGRAADTTLMAGGSSPSVARIMAEVFAIRQALFQGREIPVLGRLLAHGPLAVDLEPTRPDDPAGDYALVVRHAPFAALGEVWKIEVPGPEPRQLAAEYRMPVVLKAREGHKRTRYLAIPREGLASDIEALITGIVRLDGEIYVHRVVAALGGRWINGLDTEEAQGLRRNLLGNTFKPLGNYLDIHHANLLGWDNRQANLQALTQAEHARLHRHYLRVYDDPTSERWTMAGSDLVRVLRPPPRLITSPHFYDAVGDDPSNGRSLRLDLAGEDNYFFELAGQPVTEAEIRNLARHASRRTNLEKVLAGIVELGGQFEFLALKCARSCRDLRPRTARNALASLINASIVAQFKTGGRGSRDYYRLLRPISPAIVAAWRPTRSRPRRRK